MSNAKQGKGPGRQAEPGDFVAETAPTGPARPMHWYQVPESLRTGTTGKVIESITITEVTVRDEQLAMRVAGADETKRGFELIKMSLVEVNDQPCSYADGTADAWVSEMRPPLRELLILAYAEHHRPKEAEQAVFLKGHKRKV